MPKKRSKRFTSYQAGWWAENIAGIYLRLKGYAILQRRFKTPYGEIDFIAKKGKMLVAIEVKYRQTLTLAAESIHLRQQERIRKAFQIFVGSVRCEPSILRMDALLMAPFCWPIHLKNAWQEQS